MLDFRRRMAVGVAVVQRPSFAQETAWGGGGGGGMAVRRDIWMVEVGR